jgi:hypothetical protein
MKILDVLFNICYAPFKTAKQNGRFAALIWLVPPLTFFAVGILKIVLFYMKPWVLIRFTPMVIAAFSVSIGTMLFIFLNRVYVTGNRNTGDVKYPILSVFVILTMIVGSIIFFAVALAKFK